VPALVCGAAAFGRVGAVTDPELVTDAGAVALLDARDGVGQVIPARAMQEAIERAGEHGVGAVGVRNSNRFGTSAYFTRMGRHAAAWPC
jgi:LDH2 family malate/lactate/ureidoglycolate dehydrogenase